MARKKFDFSGTLSSVLPPELNALIEELIVIKKADDPIFDAKIDEFVKKYQSANGPASLEELLDKPTSGYTFENNDTDDFEEMLRSLIS